MQVLPVGGLYSALEEEKRRAREEAMRREMEERAKKEGGCPTCCTMVGPQPRQPQVSSELKTLNISVIFTGV